MARRPRRATVSADQKVAMSTDALLMAALERGGDTSKTGRFLITYKEGAAAAGMKALQARRGLRVASAKDFASQAMDIQQAGDADAVMFPEIGVALVSSEAVAEHGLTTAAFAEEDAHAQSVDPEYFMFASQINPADYLKGVLRTAEMIAEDLGGVVPTMPADVSAQIAGVTWGLSACKVPYSQFSGKGIKVAVLDTGFDLGHPEFAGRSFVTNTFVGDPVQDVHGHGTHTVGTACGPLAPAGPIQRYGIGYGAQIFVGKVLSNSGSGTQAQVLAGMNWAIANKCAVISMSLGAQIPV
jgi:subtilisin